MGKNSYTVQETWVQSLGQKDPLEEEMATHSSILAWRIQWTEEPGGLQGWLQSMGSQRVRLYWVTEHTRSGIRCCENFSLVVESGGYSLDVVHGFLIGEASLVMEHRLWDMQVSVVVTPSLKSTGSIAVAHGLSCSLACGIFLDQGLNLCLLHWQVDSLPLSHRGSPCFFLLKCGYFILVLLGFQVVIPIYSTGGQGCSLVCGTGFLGMGFTDSFRLRTVTSLTLGFNHCWPTCR